MNAEECRRILGVPADGGPKAIRQAYLDLARVWHPDRFQSDARLRRIAEEHFKQVNHAYTTLKNGRPSQTATSATRTAGAATTMADPPHPPHPPPEPAWTPPPFRNHRRPGRRGWLKGDPLLQTVLVAALVSAPLFAAFKILPLLMVPVLDTDLIASRGIQPRILAPMRTIDASSDVRSAANAFTEWAHGDVIDLWKPAGTDAPPTRMPAGHALRIPPERKQPAPPAPTPPAPPPASGADLLPAGRSGAGELRLANQSNLEAIVKLVTRQGATVRAVYIASNSSATLHSIGIGVYDLNVDLGRDLDTEHLRFRNSRITPTPLGPFQFAEITSDTGVSGNRYEVVLNPR